MKIEFNAPKPVFEKNKRFQLDVEEVVNHAGKEDAPSLGMKPKRPTNSKTDRILLHFMRSRGRNR